MDISIPKIWQRVGPRTWQLEVKAWQFAGDAGRTFPNPTGREIAGSPGNPFLMVLHWSGSASYMKVSAFSRNDQGGAFNTDFKQVFEMLESYGIARERIPSSLQRARAHCLAAEVSDEDEITLTFQIDTDSPEFLEDAARRAPGRFILKVEVWAVAATDDTGGGLERTGVLHVHLEPATRMERYDGSVAVDLGNTNSTLVCLASCAQGHASDVEVVNVDKTKTPGPILSALLVQKFEPPPEDDPDRMESAECLLGTAALEAGSGWLVLGAKRILAESDPKVQHLFSFEEQTYRVDKRLPAELFLAGLFREFHREKFRVPRQLAITHPATFSPWEIEQLRLAVVQGWRRSLGATTKSYDATRLTKPALPHLIIDEASAAAFYFLYRDFIDVPGGVNLLHYLYPEGLNLLVYDCGGGTTDIALVHVGVESNQLRQGQQVSKLKIEVLGRTGHRTFGGDDITIAAFRALKARLASKILGATKLPYPEMPQGAGSLARWLDEHRRDISAAVPTEFDADNPGLGDNRRRRKTAELMWQWAEKYKIAVGIESPVKLKEGVAELTLGLARNLEEHHKEARTPNVDPTRIASLLQGIEMYREEIDAQIRSPLDQSIEYANKMITAKLGSKQAKGLEVHRVYVVGNSSRYPTVREAIGKNIRVSFISQRFDKEQGEDLKNSVAKGAALALQVLTQAQAIELDFDRRLSNKLPFDITFWDSTAGIHRVIFHEHSDYDQLTERRLPVPESDGSDPERRQKDVFLDRRWPGDSKPSRYVRFQFQEVVCGPLIVFYDSVENKFKMRDEGGTGGDVVGEEIEQRVYVAPMQSGKL
jgi:hypothetical protein